MRCGRLPALLGLALGIALLGVGSARAGEIAPPEGSKNEFSGAPDPQATTIQASGKYTLVDGWSLSTFDTVELRIHKVDTDKDGKKTVGDLVKRFDGKKDVQTLWTATATGLSANTEYFVQGKVKLAKNGTVNDYAFRYTEAVLVKTKMGGGFMEGDCPPCCPPPPPP